MWELDESDHEHYDDGGVHVDERGGSDDYRVTDDHRTQGPVHVRDEDRSREHDRQDGHFNAGRERLRVRLRDE
jgi:hypothetical protein